MNNTTNTIKDTRYLNYFILKSHNTEEIITGITALPLLDLFTTKIEQTKGTGWTLVHEIELKKSHATKLYDSIKGIYGSKDEVHNHSELATYTVIDYEGTGYHAISEASDKLRTTALQEVSTILMGVNSSK